LFSQLNNLNKASSGMALLEVLVALGILGIVAVVFLTGVATTTKAKILVTSVSPQIISWQITK
jgi:prepilin-type N-terminal cleavage/methylation domain-containing protein